MYVCVCVCVNSVHVGGVGHLSVCAHACVCVRFISFRHEIIMVYSLEVVSFSRICDVCVWVMRLAMCMFKFHPME